jgi:hypothetical protein
MTLATARNILIIVALAALVVLLPGGGTGARVALQALYLLFLATLGWFAMTMYRQHRATLYSLGDRRRAIIYGALVVLAVTLTGTQKLWNTGAGSVTWLVLVGLAAYAIIAIVWSARKY